MGVAWCCIKHPGASIGEQKIGCNAPGLSSMTALSKSAKILCSRYSVVRTDQDQVLQIRGSPVVFCIQDRCSHLGFVQY